MTEALPGPAVRPGVPRRLLREVSRPVNPAASPAWT
jgi:hypothetical protein